MIVRGMRGSGSSGLGCHNEPRFVQQNVTRFADLAPCPAEL
jgi:hypothetical protein